MWGLVFYVDVLPLDFSFRCPPVKPPLLRGYRANSDRLGQPRILVWRVGMLPGARAWRRPPLLLRRPLCVLRSPGDVLVDRLSVQRSGPRFLALLALRERAGALHYVAFSERTKAIILCHVFLHLSPLVEGSHHHFGGRNCHGGALLPLVDVHHLPPRICYVLR